MTKANMRSAPKTFLGQKVPLDFFENQKFKKKKKYHPKNFQCPTSTFTHQHHHLLAKRALNLVHKSVLKSYFFATLKIQSLNPFSYNYVMDRRSSVIAEMKVPHKCGYEKLNVYMDGKSTYLDLLHHPFLVKIVRNCNGLLTNN